ncbi:28S ribosomal protein S18c, mitochondrial [Halocaridina rubra]|uniref:28S ribosomal protein S18c, mitochondrial n=1 Tax=Halocaridina rubra TaxID=373956 RepID=A0AAN8XMQ5_HALRR
MARLFARAAYRHIFPRVNNVPLWRVSTVPCTTSTSVPNSSTKDSIPKQTSWDPLKVEEIIREQSAKDMPVEILNPYEEERIQCILCRHNIHVDYKNVRLLSQFISPYTGRIYGRHITRLCRRQQELVEFQITKSRKAGYMAVMLKSVEYLKDPRLFDPNNPDRPHKF